MRRSVDEIKRMTQWFCDGKYGVMMHFLGDYRGSDEEWNARVDAFDCEGLAKQLHEIGANHYLFTICQHGGRFPFPNKAIEEYCREYGIDKQVCSKRDLVADLYDALSKYDIKLMLYTAFGNPCAGEMVNVFDFKPKKGHTEKSKTRWLNLLREVSLRYGDKVKGWWVDGCYSFYPEFATPDTQFQKDFEEALRAGNPDTIIAFNPGIVVKNNSIYEQYTCGESNEWCAYPEDRIIDGVQWHVLTYLGPWWTDRVCAHSTKELVNYSKACFDKEGVLTFDVAFDEHGLIQPEHFEQLMVLKHFIREVDSFNQDEIPESQSYLDAMATIEEPDAIPEGLINIALNKPCYSASDFNEKMKPGLAVDGDVSTFWAQGDDPGEAYWMVDLEKEYDIAALEVVIRDFNNGERSNFEFRASNDKEFGEYEVLLTQGDFPYPMRKNWAKVYEKPIRARYVKFVSIGRWHYQCLSEVRVFVKQ